MSKRENPSALPTVADFAEAEKTLLEMLAIRGGSCKEGEVADFITRRLLSAGVPESAIRCDRAHRHSVFGGETGNLICKLPGTVRALAAAPDGPYGYRSALRGRPSSPPRQLDPSCG